ncbi:DsbA family protein [Paractinoplanes lichenicola]|uniref:Thioredoxin domain-containing protein n=1 Tax=Paractinoplanes lichenicola TaxID=2802976 RepID=A0ABS1W1G5_9ACTN|nr:thioredoxin domain-containing protein [Actinoplanes lichenicola]MBL7260532.1 thioredoxin domain-containing protein [Actinoplanes lichenicola]
MSKGNRGRDRAAAQRIVEQQKAAERRRQVTIWTSVGVVAVLLIAGLVGWGVLANQDKKTDASKVNTPSVAVDDGTAFAVGTGPVTVDIYEDFMCPICHSFEQQTGPTIAQLVTDKKVTVRYHPVSILDRASNGTEYSTRSAGAAAAAAVDGKFLEYHNVLFENQPEENSDGLTNEKLIELGQGVGLGDTFATAVNEGTYKSWATKTTETFASRGFNGTPTIVVNGKQVEGPNNTLPTTEIFTQAVTAAAG